MKNDAKKQRQRLDGRRRKGIQRNARNALKYLFRAGLKQEQGISPLDKQIEDLRKAVFYLQDEIQFLKSKQQEQ